MGGLLIVWTAPYQTCLKRACVTRLLSGLFQLFYLCLIHSRPQSPRSFWPAAGIESSGPDFLSSPTILSQSDLLDLTGSPWIADLRCWTRPELLQVRRIMGSVDENGSQSSLFPAAGQGERSSGVREKQKSPLCMTGGKRVEVLRSRPFSFPKPRSPWPAIGLTRALGASMSGIRFVFSFKLKRTQVRRRTCKYREICQIKTTYKHFNRNYSLQEVLKCQTVYYGEILTLLRHH